MDGEQHGWLDRWTAAVQAGADVFPGDVTLNQLRVVATLGKMTRVDECASLAALVDASGLPRSTVGRALDLALREGWVRWEVDPEDSRRRTWCLTPQGRTLRPQLADAMKERWPG